MRINRKALKEYALRRQDFFLYYVPEDEAYYMAGTNIVIIDDLTLLQKIARIFEKWF